jgi:hypothetical protein
MQTVRLKCSLHDSIPCFSGCTAPPSGAVWIW